MPRSAKPTKKTTTAKTSKGKRPVRQSPHRSWLGLLFKLSLAAMVPFLAWLIYLDATVTRKFEGQRWELPAKVYARPLELYAGKQLAPRDLVYELELMGYRRGADLDAPGEYFQSGSQISFYSRGFGLWNEQLTAQRVSVQFSGTQVNRLLGPMGTQLDILSLEPYLIGGIYPQHGEDRLLVQLKDVPRTLVDALIVVEDQDFYSHWGVSPKGILRALWVNAKAGGTLQGGSTLTQQLVKNFYLTSERTLQRKITEALMSLLLELHYDKDEILEAYINEVYLGQSGSRAIHGFALASQYYFGVSLSELKLHQAALLAAMVKGPSYYNPRRQPERALARRNLVLDLLAQEAVVAADTADWAKRQPLSVTDQPRYTEAAYPAFMDLVQRQLQRDYRREDLTSEGLRIFTSFDPIAQREAEASLAQGIKRLQGIYGKPVEQLQGALVLTSAETGEVQALVGGRDAKFSGFNRALDAIRPVGSILKPAVYLTALSAPQRYQLSTIIEDNPIRVEAEGGRLWEPQNFDKRSHGLVPLHKALAHSYNQATARLGLELGVESVLATVNKLGVERRLPPYPSVFLGTGGLAPIEVAAMYQTIAAGGFDTPLRSIRAVMDAEGEVLSRYTLNVEQRFDPGVIHLLHYALQETMREGTGEPAYDRLPHALNIAGKTGSTNDLRDSWFAGFTGDQLAIVWLGNDDNSPTQLSGSTGALQIWTELMRRIDPQPFTGTVPENVIYHWVDERTGLLSGEHCEGARYLPFIRGSEPRRHSECIGQPSRFGDWIKSWFR